MSYRAVAKAAKVEPVAVVSPVKPPLAYPHDGYINATETTQDRYDRLYQAQGDGYTLGPLDSSFMRRKEAHKNRGWRHPKEQAKMWGEIAARELAQSRSPFMGGSPGSSGTSKSRGRSFW